MTGQVRAAAVDRAAQALYETAARLIPSQCDELPALIPLHDAAVAACAVNGDTKRADWESFRRAVVLWRYVIQAELGRKEAQTAVRALIRPADGSAVAAMAAFQAFCWLFGTVPAPQRVGQAELPALPFVPYPYQEHACALALEMMLEPPDPGRDLAVLKSRQTGLTTAFLHLDSWLWLTTPHLTMGLGSRAQSEVDVNPGSQNPHSLLGRCEAIVDRLPRFLQPPGYDLADKAMRQMGQWINPDNHARLDGEASSPHFSRSRTYMHLLVDEWAMWPDAEAVLAASAPNVKLLRIFLTTALPDQPAVEDFYDRMREAWPNRVLEIQWWEHPERDTTWEQAERTRLGDKLFAQEHELSFQADAERVIYGEWRDVPQGDYPFDPDWPLLGGIDFGRRDGTALVLMQCNPESDRARLLASYFSAGQTIDFYAPLMGGLMLSPHNYSRAELAWIARIGRWIRQAGGIAWFGDPAGLQLTQLANLSVIDVLERHGISVTVNEKVRSHEERQSAVRQMLRNCEVDRSGCRSLDDAMRKYRWPVLNVRATNAPKRAPIHRDSHLPTALEFLAVHRDVWSPRRRIPLTLPRHKGGWERTA